MSTTTSSDWLKEYDLFYNSQSSNKEYHSCITSLVNLVDQHVINMGGKLLSLVTMLDLGKVSDVLN